MYNGDRPALLAVDLGLRTGLAAVDVAGRLLWYRSHNLGSATRLRRAAQRILDDLPTVRHLFAEGDRNLFAIWAREAERRGIDARLVSAETWRDALLLGRQKRSGRKAKEAADGLARRIIESSGAKRPTSLRHDAAEAILLATYGAHVLGWLEHLPTGG